MTTIKLTPVQWVAFGRGMKDDEGSALPTCCANISDLRDIILRIADNGGVLTPDLAADLAKHWGFCLDGHDFNDDKFPSWKTLRSLIEQAGLPWKRAA